MNTELVWHNHEGGRCPVPGKTIVSGIKHCLYGDSAHGWSALAERIVWNSITAFALDPSQPACLNGPLVVGGKYVRRDGLMTGSLHFDGTYFVDPKTCRTYSAQGEWIPGCKYPEDLIARYYSPTAPAAVVEAIVCDTCAGSGEIDETLGGEYFSDPHAKCPDCDGQGEWAPRFPTQIRQVPAGAEETLAAAKAEWLARRMRKCSEIQKAASYVPFSKRYGCGLSKPITPQQLESRSLTILSPNADSSWKSGVRLGYDR